MGEVLEKLGAYGPQYIILALIIIALWKSGALKEIFKKREAANVLPKFVLKEECHKHIDSLKKEISDTRVELKEHINAVDEKVNILLKAALK